MKRPLTSTEIDTVIKNLLTIKVPNEMGLQADSVKH